MPSRSHRLISDSGDPSARLTQVELPPDIRDELLDPVIWQEALEAYALSTHLAVAFTNAQGRLIGNCINPHPTWSLLHANQPAEVGGCPFALLTLNPCACFAKALTKGSPVLARDRAGLVHFAVPLMLGEHQLGALVAGQVFDQYPEQLPLERIAKKFGLSPDKVWQMARLEQPVKGATLQVYGRLLATLGNSFIRTHYHAIIEEGRLAEMTRLRDLLEQRTKALIEADRRKDEFLATLSHELRTPLNAIFGWAQILRTNRFDETTSATAVKTIERNAKSLAQIIEDLLDVSRIISGKLRLDVSPVEVAPIVESLINTVRPSADAKGIQIDMRLDPEKCIVSGDSTRLQQVLSNLLSNAFKFTPKGGRVEVRLECINSSVQITVSDTGRGISPVFLPYIFDRFRQADSTSKRSHGGLGLGLAIVHHLVELHGGTVTAHSDGEGSGATFLVRLPLITAQMEANGLEKVYPTDTDVVTFDSLPSLEGLRVLVVDDEDGSREMLVSVLGECGAEVTAVASADEALDVLGGETSDQRPEVLISDIAMPGKDGYELIREVRALGSECGGKIPAIALTGYAGNEEKMRALLSGFQMHLAKPVKLAELLAMVASLAGRTISVD